MQAQTEGKGVRDISVPLLCSATNPNPVAAPVPAVPVMVSRRALPEAVEIMSEEGIEMLVDSPAPISAAALAL